MRIVMCILGIIVLLMTPAALEVWIDSSPPTSSPGVSLVADATVRLPNGEDMVVTQNADGADFVWHITYDGADTVYFDKDDGWSPGRHLKGKLCGVGCTAKVDMSQLAGSMEITHRADGAVNVHWPQGWSYRPYRS